MTAGLATVLLYGMIRSIQRRKCSARNITDVTNSSMCLLSWERPKASTKVRVASTDGTRWLGRMPTVMSETVAGQCQYRMVRRMLQLLYRVGGSAMATGSNMGLHS